MASNSPEELKIEISKLINRFYVKDIAKELALQMVADTRDDQCQRGNHDYKVTECFDSNEKYVCQRTNCCEYYWD